MAKSRIEWTDFTVNPIKGLCPMHCKTPDGYEYCYAAGERGLYKRFKWNPEIYYDDRVWLKQLRCINRKHELVSGNKYFVGSTIELFGDWIRPEWMEDIFRVIRSWGDDDVFIFLTKQPQNLIKWSPFPDNCWVGVSATNRKMFNDAVWYLKDVSAKVKYISFEPLLEPVVAGILDNHHDWPVMHGSILQNVINWLIIGQQTPVSKKTEPKRIWIDEIILAAQKAAIPYFLKDNLKSIMGDNLVQSFPKGAGLDH